MTKTSTGELYASRPPSTDQSSLPSPTEYAVKTFGFLMLPLSMSRASKFVTDHSRSPWAGPYALPSFESRLLSEQSRTSPEMTSVEVDQLYRFATVGRVVPRVRL